MKTLLALMIFLFQLTSLSAGELDSVQIVTPVTYQKVTKRGQKLKSSAAIMIGDIIGAADIGPKIKESIAPYKLDLSKYFPESELDLLVNYLIIQAKKEVIGYHKDIFGTERLNALNDQKAIDVNKFFGNKLIGKIADRILEVEGVKEADRRKLWVDKILAPFNQCMASASNALYAADHCMDALTSSLVPSAGVGLTYELSRSSLVSSLPENERPDFYKEQVKIYKDCISKSTNPASDTKDCVLSAMKNGVIKITDLGLSKTINKTATSPGTAKAIKQSVWPHFSMCADKVGTDDITNVSLNDQFVKCIDDLTRLTGALLVEDKLANTAAIKDAFSKSEMSSLILAKVQNFKDCVDLQKKNNKRKDGVLDTEKCENTITNDVTYKVIVKTLAQSAADSFKASPDISADIAKEGKSQLDKCWSNEQTPKQRESCLRKTILSFSQTVATVKLNKAIPNDLKNKNDLTKNSLKDLAACLDKQLPDNISEAKNLSAITDSCSNKLTRNVALLVARETIKTSAEGKVSPEETEVLVNTLVNQKFSKCLGDSPTDAKLDDCSGDLTKEATKSIVIAYEKQEIKKQLNADNTPSKLKPVEDEFVACVDKASPSAEVSQKVDECTKQFAIEFARTLGELKLATLMNSVLGSEGYNEQKKSIDNILGKYNSCLDDLKPVSMDDGLLEKLAICTDGLERRVINFISSTVNTWMSTEEKDAATIMVKQEFANFIPCLGELVPASPYSQRMQQNVESILKPMAVLIAQYIEYSPEDAKRSLDEIINRLSTDLKDLANSQDSRKELIEILYQNGALDQFLKSMVRGEVKKSLEATPESELPRELREQLLQKENFDKIFASEEGKAIKEKTMEKILTPLLMEKASLSSPVIKIGMEAVNDRVVKMLLNSPHFGEQIIKSSVQSKINNMGGFTRLLAKVLYGKNSLNWEKVRTTKAGIAAENYIRDNVLLPKFKGQKLSKAEEDKIMAEAEKLVKTAVKNYD